MEPVANFAPLYEDINPTEDFGLKRPLLGHYTSVRSFESILKNNQVWLSSPLFMNDYEEMRFGMNEALEQIEEGNALSRAYPEKDFKKRAKEQFSRFYEIYANGDALGVYVLCLSEHDEDETDGKLSMWRGYGASGDGICLLIDSAMAEPERDTPFILSKVSYASRDERKAKIESYINKFAGIVKALDPRVYSPETCVYFLFERIKLYSLFTKHSGFSEEREWRLVYLSENDPNKIYGGMIDYHIGKFGIEPKLKLDLQKLPGITPGNDCLEQIAKSVIVGPSISSPLSLEMIKRMTKKLGRTALSSRIVTSEIPFRKRVLLET